MPEDHNVMRHAYRPLSEKEQEWMREIKDAGLFFYRLCEDIGASRELSLAKTKIEEAVMWATKHVSRGIELPAIAAPAVTYDPSEVYPPITLALLWRIAVPLKRDGSINYVVVRIHTDLEPDVCDLPGFTPVERYNDVMFAEEFGRCERFIFVCDPDARSVQDQLKIYPFYAVAVDKVNGSGYAVIPDRIVSGYVTIKDLDANPFFATPPAGGAALPPLAGTILMGG